MRPDLCSRLLFSAVVAPCVGCDAEAQARGCVKVERFAAAKGGRNWAAINRALSKDPIKVMALLRLSPLMPFSVSNYLYGLTSMDFSSYIAGSWAGMLPGTARLAGPTQACALVVCCPR